MPEIKPEKPSVIIAPEMYQTMRRIMLKEGVKRDGEMIRRILARDAAMREEAEATGIDLDKYVVKPIGGNHRSDEHIRD